MASDTKFKTALDFVLKFEGGFVDHANDPGGATNHGISLRYLRRQQVINGDLDRDGDIDGDDVRHLNQGHVAEIYKANWWDKYSYSLLPSAVAKRIFSIAVNMGPSTGHRIAQRACRAAGKSVTEDGILGPETRSAILSLDKGAYISGLRAEAAGHYRLLAEQNRDFEPFLEGWLNRAYS